MNRLHHTNMLINLGLESSLCIIRAGVLRIITNLAIINFTIGNLLLFYNTFFLINGIKITECFLREYYAHALMQTGALVYKDTFDTSEVASHIKELLKKFNEGWFDKRVFETESRYTQVDVERLARSIIFDSLTRSITNSLYLGGQSSATSSSSNSNSKDEQAQCLIM